MIGRLFRFRGFSKDFLGTCIKPPHFEPVSTMKYTAATLKKCRQSVFFALTPCGLAVTFPDPWNFIFTAPVWRKVAVRPGTRSIRELA